MNSVKKDTTFFYGQNTIVYIKITFHERKSQHVGSLFFKCNNIIYYINNIPFDLICAHALSIGLFYLIDLSTI